MATFDDMESGEQPNLRRRELLKGIAAVGAAAAAGPVQRLFEGSYPKAARGGPELLEKREDWKEENVILDLETNIFQKFLDDPDGIAKINGVGASEHVFAYSKAYEKAMLGAAVTSAGILATSVGAAELGRVMQTDEHENKAEEGRKKKEIRTMGVVAGVIGSAAVAAQIIKDQPKKEYIDAAEYRANRWINDLKSRGAEISLIEISRRISDLKEEQVRSKERFYSRQ